MRNVSRLLAGGMSWKILTKSVSYYTNSVHCKGQFRYNTDLKSVCMQNRHQVCVYAKQTSSLYVCKTDFKSVTPWLETRPTSHLTGLLPCSETRHTSRLYVCKTDFKSVCMQNRPQVCMYANIFSRVWGFWARAWQHFPLRMPLISALRCSPWRMFYIKI